MASEHLPDKFYTIYGQHDLPQHSMELAHKSGLYNLWKNGKVTILPTCSFGQTPNGVSKYFLLKNCTNAGWTVLVWHTFAYQGKLPWPGCTSPMGASLLRKYPQYDLLVLGDNHKPFTETYEGRLLVNVGSMMRTTADQMDYKPCVWLWYAETNTVTKVYLPIEDDVISREHLEIKEQRDNRIDAFVSKLNDEFETSLSFEDNLLAFEQANNVRKSVMEIIYRSIDS